MSDKNDDTQTNTPRETPTARQGRRPYQAPRILSAEPLEAAAATCDPPTGAFGKTVPIPCGSLGS